MGSSSSTMLPCLYLFIFCALFQSPALADPISISSIPVNFTVSFLQFIDHGGVFLVSEKRSFVAGIISFYLVVIHASSNTTVWSANRNHPVSPSSELRLTADGLTLYNHTTQPIWSTPRSPSSVSSMQLLDSGNLLLLDATKNILWQSFDFPTDSVVAGQTLRVGKSLVASSGGEEPSEGSYKLVIGDDDAMLQWNEMVYWKLSMDVKAFKDTISPVEFLMVNSTGVLLMGGNGGEVVMRRYFNVSENSLDFVLVKLDYRGVLNVLSFDSVDRTRKQVMEGPDDKCQIPMICRKLDVCSNMGGSCWCAPGFRKIENGDCVPKDTSLALPGSCNNVDTHSNFKYLSLSDDFGLDYFSNDFTDPVIHEMNLSSCQNLCSKNCSCFGVFYTQSSESCYLIENYLGSMKLGSRNRVGYLKMVVAIGSRNSDVENKPAFATIAAVLLPSAAVLAIAVLAMIGLRRRRRRRLLEKRASSENEEMDLISIPGLPVRLDYKELVEATQEFSTEIGSGGFGTVYKGNLRDGSEVAVKKIRSLGAQGKREFLSEIAVIGKIRHVNLVKLKGFCLHNGERFLIYEYMNRGSLDRTLFHGEAALEWKERYKIAAGAARGLEYLHSGCESKIIHCDVKPENILIDDTLQVKVSDFGLSKLLRREQSGFFTTLRGTRGYVAPEWLTNTAISDKTDVYSYGMVISGVHNFSLAPRVNSPACVVNFPLRALEMHAKGRYMELVDPRLEGNTPSEQVETLVCVALCCLHRDPNLRPSMCNVVRMLEGGMALSLCKPRLDSLNFLRSYGAGENNQQNELALDRQQMSCGTTTSDNSFSYISSHQVSGPR